MNSQDISKTSLNSWKLHSKIIIKPFLEKYKKSNVIYEMFLDRITLNFKLKGTYAGKANLIKEIIYINHDMMAENIDHFKNQTIPHELCHLICYFLDSNEKPHGNLWKTLMMSLGLTPKIRHTLSSDYIRKTYNFKLNCQCTVHNLSKNMYNKILKNPDNYRCKKCKSKITKIEE